MAHLQSSDLKKGLIIWWSRYSEGYGGTWDCPCIVTDVNLEKNTYRVFYFDDFKETGNLQIERPDGSDKSSLTEMRLSSLAEVERFLLKLKSKWQAKVDESKQAMEKAQFMVDLCGKDPIVVLKERIVGMGGEVVDI